MAEEQTEQGFMRISPLELKAAKRNGHDRVSVTAASAPYCEAKTLYELSGVALEEEQRSQAMERGAQVHNQVEEALYGDTGIMSDDLLPQNITSPNEEWYDLLARMYLKLKLLAPKQPNTLEANAHCMARELPVFGHVKNTRIYGIMDLIYWRDKRLHICDMKTTYKRAAPEEPQMTAHTYQTMLYHYLFADMCRDVDATMGKYLGDEIDLDREVGADFVSAFEKATSGDLSVSVPSVRQMIQHIGAVMPKPRYLAKSVSVEYVKRSQDRHPEEYQPQYPKSEYTQPQSFAVLSVPIDYKALKQVMAETLPFWHGERAAIGVDGEDMRKCRSCQFRPVCGWYN